MLAEQGRDALVARGGRFHPYGAIVSSSVKRTPYTQIRITLNDGTGYRYATSDWSQDFDGLAALKQALASRPQQP